MSDIQQSPDTPRETILAEIAVVPLEEDEDDLEAISAAADVAADVYSGIQALQDYRSCVVSDATRSAGIILLLGEVAQQIMAQKDLLIAFLQAGTAAIGVLSKQRRVSKIDLSLGGDSISIENPDTVTVEKLRDAFLAKHPAVEATITPSSKLQVTATVSKRARPADR